MEYGIFEDPILVRQSHIIKSIGPHRVCFRTSLRGIKVFVTFKKADYHGKIETSIFVSEPHIKMERLSSGPSRALLSQFPSGDKFINIP